MITNNDCILLLSDLESKGNQEAGNLIIKIAGKGSVDLDVLKFINNNKPLEVIEFYEHIRKNYNKKKSNIYINIVKDVEQPYEVLTTLSALLTQILLYSKKLDENQTLFLKHSRAEEISKVLAYYFKTYDITKAIQLLKLIKLDLLALETVQGRRK